MTSSAVGETAGELFRRALGVVRDMPVAPVDRAPAFELRAGQLPLEPAQTGTIEGVANDAWSIAEAIALGRASVEETVAASANAIRGHSERLGAFEYVADVSVVARRMDQGHGSSDARGPLYGVPVSVKDVIDVSGMPTTGSSRAVPSRIAASDPIAVARLRDAGAIIVGKTVTHEFALGVTTPQSCNPWDEERVPGGSSGGSVISVVTGMAAASLGTDTRASIRVPAALSGAIGFKATYGLIPVDRWMTLSWSIDHFAPMARSVRDIALLMDVLCAAGTNFREALPGSMVGVRIGVPPAATHGASAGVASSFNAAVAAFAAAGAIVQSASVPGTDDFAVANAAGMVVSRVEAAQHHTESGTDISACTPEVRAQLEEALTVPATDYVRCMRLRGTLRERLLSAFEDADVLAMPTSNVTAPLRSDADRYLLILSENCIPWSFTGFPAISLFAGMDAGLPTGIQLVARPGADAQLLSIAYAAERLLPPLPKWSPL
jgi:aspartyl-tRNA(Asn)/glutamyl-tRNA(Gln) amidotransferase subunit A